MVITEDFIIGCAGLIGFYFLMDRVIDPYFRRRRERKEQRLSDQTKEYHHKIAEDYYRRWGL